MVEDYKNYLIQFKELMSILAISQTSVEDISCYLDAVLTLQQEIILSADIYKLCETDIGNDSEKENSIIENEARLEDYHYFSPRIQIRKSTVCKAPNTDLSTNMGLYTPALKSKNNRNVKE